MKTLVLQNGVGRFGNKIRQLLHVIFCCQKYGFSFSDKNFSCEFIRYGDSQFYSAFNEAADNIFDEKSFFWLNDLCHFCRKQKGLAVFRDVIDYKVHFCSKLLLSEYLKLSHLFLRGLLTLQPQNIDESICVIHIRSGDVFDKASIKPSMHGGYTQPPVAFYENIIKSERYEKYLVLTEPDKKNPCLEVLSKYSNVMIQSGSFEDDFAIMLGAKHFVLSNSTLSFAALCLSKEIKKIYVCKELHWDFKENQESFGFEVVRYGFKTSYTAINQWSCSDEQLRLMLSYPVADCERLR